MIEEEKQSVCVVRFADINQDYCIQVDQFTHVLNIKEKCLQAAQLEHKDLSIISTDYVLLPEDVSTIDNSLMTPDLGLCNEICIEKIYPNLKDIKLYMTYKAILPSPPSSKQQKQQQGQEEQLYEVNSDNDNDQKQTKTEDVPDLNRNALDKRASLTQLGGGVKKLISAHSSSRESISCGGTSSPLFSESRLNFSDTEDESDSYYDGNDCNNKISGKFDITEVLSMSEEAVECYKNWNVKRGLELVTILIPILVHIRGKDYPLAKKFVRMQSDFKIKRRVRFMLTVEQAHIERSTMTKQEKSSSDQLFAVTTEIKDIGDMHVRCKTYGRRSSLRNNVITAPIMNEKINFIMKTYINEMKHGECLIKLKQHEPTDRWFYINKSADKLLWRRATNQEKKNNKRSMFSFALGREHNLSDIEALYYGPQASRGFITYIREKRKPWLCFSIEFSNNENSIDIICPNETSVTRWFQGLQHSSPLNNSHLSLGLFLWQRLVMKINYYTLKEVAKRLDRPFMVWKFNHTIAEEEIALINKLNASCNTTSTKTKKKPINNE